MNNGIRVAAKLIETDTNDFSDLQWSTDQIDLTPLYLIDWPGITIFVSENSIPENTELFASSQFVGLTQQIIGNPNKLCDFLQDYSLGSVDSNHTGNSDVFVIFLAISPIESTMKFVGLLKESLDRNDIHANVIICFQSEQPTDMELFDKLDLTVLGQFQNLEDPTSKQLRTGKYLDNINSTSATSIFYFTGINNIDIEIKNRFDKLALIDFDKIHILTNQHRLIKKQDAIIADLMHAISKHEVEMSELACSCQNRILEIKQSLETEEAEIMETDIASLKLTVKSLETENRLLAEQSAKLRDFAPIKIGLKLYGLYRPLMTKIRYFVRKI